MWYFMDDFRATVDTSEYNAYVRNLEFWRNEYVRKKTELVFVAISPTFEPRKISVGAHNRNKVFYFYNPHRRGMLRKGIYSALAEAVKSDPSVQKILGHGLKQLLVENPNPAHLNNHESIHRFLTEFRDSELGLLDLHEEPAPTDYVEGMLLQGRLDGKLIDRVRRLECEGCVVLWKKMGTFVQKTLLHAGVHAEVGSFPFPGKYWRKSIQDNARAITKIARLI